MSLKKKIKNKRFLNSYIACYRREMLSVLVCSLLSSLMTVACSRIMNQVIRETLGGQGGNLLRGLAILCALAVVWVIFIYLQRMLSGKLGLLVTQKLRAEVTEKLMGMSYESFMEQGTGSFLNRLNDDIRDTADYMDKLLSAILSNGIMIAVISLYLCTVDWKLLLASLVWIPAATLIFRTFLKSISALSREKKKGQDKLTDVIREAFDCTETEKSYNLQERDLGISFKAIDGIVSVDLKQQKKEAFLMPFAFGIQSLPVLFCCLFGAFLAWRGNLAVEDFISFMVLLGFISQPITNFTAVLVDLKKAGVGVERLESLLALPDEETGGEPVSGSKEGAVISFQNVSFSYPGSRAILKGVSFTVKKGERIAFVGSSGGGKSTLANLILGLYSVKEGDYLLYGSSFSKLDLKEARKCFSIVSQEPFLFPDTIEENLHYGNRNASMEEIRRVMKAVELDDYVCGLSQGYRTVLEEGGANLSGGQKQRLSIARALLRKSEIVLMDEPTSALDGETEAEIVKLADTLLAGKTIITIAHKLNTVRDYDCICVLDNGRIAEQGSHDGLMAMGGLYYKLFTGFREREGA